MKVLMRALIFCTMEDLTVTSLSASEECQLEADSVQAVVLPPKKDTANLAESFRACVCLEN